MIPFFVFVYRFGPLFVFLFVCVSRCTVIPFYVFVYRLGPWFVLFGLCIALNLYSFF